MKTVDVELEEIKIEKNGRLCDGVCATCGDCNNTVEVAGVGESAERSALRRLSSTCPFKEDGRKRYRVLRD